MIFFHFASALRVNELDNFAPFESIPWEIWRVLKRIVQTCYPIWWIWKQTINYTFSKWQYSLLYSVSFFNNKKFHWEYWIRRRVASVWYYLKIFKRKREEYLRSIFWRFLCTIFFFPCIVHHIAWVVCILHTGRNLNSYFVDFKEEETYWEQKNKCLIEWINIDSCQWYRSILNFRRSLSLYFISLVINK